MVQMSEMKVLNWLKQSYQCQRLPRGPAWTDKHQASVRFFRDRQRMQLSSSLEVSLINQTEWKFVCVFYLTSPPPPKKRSGRKGPRQSGGGREQRIIKQQKK